MAATPQSLAHEILFISHEMYDHARRGDWLRFGEQESKRRKIIEALFAHPDTDVSLDELARILRQVLVIDNKSIALGEQEKQRLSREITDQKQHQQAAQHYQCVAMN